MSQMQENAYDDPLLLAIEKWVYMVICKYCNNIFLYVVFKPSFNNASDIFSFNFFKTIRTSYLVNFYLWRSWKVCIWTKSKRSFVEYTTCVQ